MRTIILIAVILVGLYAAKIISVDMDRLKVLKAKLLDWFASLKAKK
jgi:ABC-type transport system involved in cytochrome bd biosynthesis fused ATPase/permease subunit